MKKKINNRAGIKKGTNKKSTKKKQPKIIVIKDDNNGENEITSTNWKTLLSENSGLL